MAEAKKVAPVVPPASDIIEYVMSMAQSTAERLGGKPTTIYLINGIKLDGEVVSTDIVGIQLKRHGVVQTVHWFAIATSVEVNISSYDATPEHETDEPFPRASAATLRHRPVR